MKKQFLVFGLIFLFVFSSFVPISIGYNVKITNNINQHSNRGKTLYVGGSGSNNYTKIQDAIDDAVDSDTVFVYDDSSPYFENVVIDKSINLIGEDRNTTIIDANYNLEVVKILADRVVLSGFTIQNSGDTPNNGIYITSDFNQIFNNIIFTNSDGIHLSGSNNTISNNDIIHNCFDGINIEDWNEDSVNNLFTNNFIAHNGDDGIQDGDRDGGTIATWNVIADNGKRWGGQGLYKQDSYGIYHHNDFFFNKKNAYVGGPRNGNDWDDGSEGNYWDDWEYNEGYPDYYIVYRYPPVPDEIDYHPSATPYTDSLIVGLSYPYYALVDEPIDFNASFFYLDIYSVDWFWDFGDGNTSNEIKPLYPYEKTGHYYINVTITDDKGRSDSSSSEVYIGRAPETPIINGPTSGKKDVTYNYTISSIDPDNDNIYFHINWGYDYSDEYIGPYHSGEVVNISHNWRGDGLYRISVDAKDTADLWSEKAFLEINIPRTRPIYDFNLMDILERFPILQRLLQL